MRKLRKLSMAVVLTFLLGTGALAGITETPPAPPPEPPSATETGIVETPPSIDQPVAAPADSVVDIALDLLLLAIF